MQSGKGEEWKNGRMEKNGYGLKVKGQRFKVGEARGLF